NGTPRSARRCCPGRRPAGCARGASARRGPRGPAGRRPGPRATRSRGRRTRSPTRAGPDRARSSTWPHRTRTAARTEQADARSRVLRVRVLLVGSGGREHALAWALARSPRLTSLHAAPGNPGIALLGDCHPVRADDGEGLLALAHGVEADLVVIGPEAPLVAGVGDELRHGGITVFGPGRAAARIEGSKLFAKELMRDAGVATAETLAVARPPCVVKVDGLAAGKGVFVCRTRDELDEALRSAAAFDGPIVIEELLEGEEVSVFALVDGASVVPLAPAQDYKRLEDGDRGPNTGGMGSFSPVPAADDSFAAE